MREPKNKGHVIVLASPDGREYRTSNVAEANELHRTRGYKFADTETQDRSAQGDQLADWAIPMGPSSEDVAGELGDIHHG